MLMSHRLVAEGPYLSLRGGQLPMAPFFTFEAVAVCCPDWEMRFERNCLGTRPRMKVLTVTLPSVTSNGAACSAHPCRTASDRPIKAGTARASESAIEVESCVGEDIS